MGGEKLPFGDEIKTKGEPPFPCNTAHALTAARKADGREAGISVGFLQTF